MVRRLALAGLLYGLWLATFGSAHAGSGMDPQLRAALRAAIADDSVTHHTADAGWLQEMSQRLAALMPDAERRLQLLQLVYAEARRAALAPNLVLAVIQVESLFDRYAISSADARGLMQVMPFWVTLIGQPRDNLFDVQTNLRYGCTILKLYLEREGGNLTRALARYNGSLGRYEYPARVHHALYRRWYQG